MTVQEFSKFWNRQGCRTAEGAGAFWYEVHPLVYLSLPYERMIRPTRMDLLKLFFMTPALVLRYPTPGTGLTGGSTGGLFVCDHKGYDLGCLHSKARNQTRKGLHDCTIRPISFSDLFETGYQLNLETWHRQGRTKTGISRRRWQRYCRAAAETPDVEAWGAFVGGRPGAFVVCARVERNYNILHQGSSRELLPHCPNNALAFAVTKRALESDDIDLVCYGLKSLENTQSLEHFKLGMGFSIVESNEKVVLHPFLRGCLRLGGTRGIRWMTARKPQSDFWRKAWAVCQTQVTEGLPTLSESICQPTANSE